MPAPQKKKKELRKTAETLFSKIIRARDGKCMRCGKTTSLQCSHVRSVGAHPKLKFNFENAIALCQRCHMYWWHKEPLEAAHWFEKTFPERNKYLEAKVQDPSKNPTDYELLVTVLTEGLKTITKGGEHIDNH